MGLADGGAGHQLGFTGNRLLHRLYRGAFERFAARHRRSLSSFFVSWPAVRAPPRQACRGDHRYAGRRYAHRNRVAFRDHALHARGIKSAFAKVWLESCAREVESAYSIGWYCAVHPEAARFMEVGAALVECARAIGRTSIAVIGTGKNVGRTVTVSALCAALEQEKAVIGLTSIGLSSESADSPERSLKPRLFLREGTLITTTRAFLLKCSALEIVAIAEEHNVLGTIVVARVRAPGHYEITGATGVDGVRRVVRELVRVGASFVVLEGSVDGIAAVRDGEDAIVLATGAARGSTPAQVVEEVQALVARLSLPLVDYSKPFVRIGGVLRADEAAILVRAGERRQILVHDATRINFGGRAFLSLASQLDVRCVCALHPVATTVASIGPSRLFEPQEFLRSVAAATGLPTYDVYAQSAA